MGGRGRGCWRAGYGGAGPGYLGYGFELVVRLGEVCGVGAVVQTVDALLHGRRFRRLTPHEAAFAKTHVPPGVLAKAYVDERSRVARWLRIAFVLGDVIKVGHPASRPLLVHELAHVGQYHRWGWAYVAKALHAQHFGAGYAYARGSPVERLNAEQEAAHAEDAARVRLGWPARWARAPTFARPQSPSP